MTSDAAAVAIAAMRIVLALLVVSALMGCASNGARIDARAAAKGFVRTQTVHAGLRTYTYMRPHAAGATLTAFLEGDGQPWLGGVEINFDPATRNPIALAMLERTSGPAAYVVRPCYLNVREPGCTPDLWTAARYSDAVIESIAAAIQDAMRRADARAVELVGYSGGGALAVLVAERLDSVTRVTTVAANLDVAAWSRLHGYLPLERSLDPARSSRSHPWRELHLQGARDVIVPPASTDKYFERYPNAQRRVIEAFGHICCWAEAWPQVLSEKNEKNADESIGRQEAHQ